MSIGSIITNKHVQHLYYNYSNGSIQNLLTSHRASVIDDANREEFTRLIVRRRHVWEDMLHKLRNNLDVTKPIRITFVGEPAIDTGGNLASCYPTY